MKVMRRLIALSAVAVLLVGCGSKLKEGEVYRKEFLPENVRSYIVPIVHFNGSTSFTTYIPMVYHYPDRWKIDIKAISADEKGEYETATYYTTKEAYDACNIGDMFVFVDSRDLETEPVNKTKREEPK